MPDAKPQANGSADSKHAASSGSSGATPRAFTVEQKSAVIRVRKCKGTDFYDILGLEAVRTTCTDSDIKKSYKKLSLLTHPDKNGYEGADEAFKLVSRAFQILSDPDKKARYDKFGGDPDNRFASASASGASPFSGYASQRGGRAGPMFEDEISPEDLFRQFFGGGMGGPFGGMGMGSPFGMGGPFGGSGFVFNVGGGPGFRVHQFGGDRPRRRPHNHDTPPQQRSALQMITGFLPLIILFILPLLSTLFSGSGGPSAPRVRFDAAVPPSTLQHTSAQLGVNYFVDPKDVKDYTARNWKDLDRIAEGQYINQLSSECQWEQSDRQREMMEARGIFWPDQERLARARARALPSCQKLESLGYRIR